MLLDDIVDTSLRSLTLGPLLLVPLSLFLTFASGFSVGSGKTSTGTGTLSLAWW
jgi:hypothetical protein